MAGEKDPVHLVNQRALADLRSEVNELRNRLDHVERAAAILVLDMVKQTFTGGDPNSLKSRAIMGHIEASHKECVVRIASSPEPLAEVRRWVSAINDYLQEKGV